MIGRTEVPLHGEACSLARAENLLHGLPLGVTVQRILCTSRRVDWTYKAPSARSGLLWCRPENARHPVRGRRLDCLEFVFGILVRFFSRRKCQQQIVGCSPRAQLNVDVPSKKLDVQGFSIRSGLRGGPKYSSWVEIKTRQKCRVLQCFHDFGRILFECIQIEKSMKTLVFYSVPWLLRSVVK